LKVTVPSNETRAVPTDSVLKAAFRDRLERDVPAAAAPGSEHGRCAERDSGDPDHSHGVTIGRASRSETLFRTNVAHRARLAAKTQAVRPLGGESVPT
jgi:hypothetical protein